MEREELLERTKCFALRVIRLVDALPQTPTGRTIANQLVRSGTSVAANYRAARRARSRKEFASKLGLVVEEADESVFWLEMIRDGNILASDRIEQLLNEAVELTRIFASARKTAAIRNDSN